MLKTIARAAAAAALIALLLAACGGGDSADSGGDASNADLTLHGLDSLKFDKPEYSTHAGDVKIALINDGALQHSVLVEGKDFKVLTNAHQTKAGTVRLDPGTYTLYCDIPTHREAGMVSKLTVTPAPPSSASSGPSSGN